MALSTARLPDDRLVARAAAGEEAAFATLHARHNARMTSVAQRVLANSSGDPEEAVQEAWIRAYRAFGSGARPMSLPGWLATITRNTCLDELSRLAARPRRSPQDVELEALPAASAADPADALVARERFDEVIDDISGLNDSQRRALLLHAVDGRDHEEISRSLRVDSGATKALVYRARRHLRARRAHRLRQELAGRVLGLAWPAKAALTAALALAGGATVGAVTQRTTLGPHRAPGWLAAEDLPASRPVPPGGRLPPGVAVVYVTVDLPARAAARRGTALVSCPTGYALAGWIVPAAADPDLLWASFDRPTAARLYAAGAARAHQPRGTGRVAYATLADLPVGRKLTFSVLCARRTAARDRAVDGLR
jgi:RNA polymerase sigma-70 factor (ECF subfamily)